jgi:hypothetical protein
VVLYLLNSGKKAEPPMTRHVRVERGRADLCSAEGDCVAATSGQVTFGISKSDTVLVGDVDFQFPTGERVRQTFKAGWKGGPVSLCE